MNEKITFSRQISLLFLLKEPLDSGREKWVVSKVDGPNGWNRTLFHVERDTKVDAKSESTLFVKLNEGYKC